MKPDEETTMSHWNKGVKLLHFQMNIRPIHSLVLVTELPNKVKSTTHCKQQKIKKNNQNFNLLHPNIDVFCYYFVFEHHI